MAKKKPTSQQTIDEALKIAKGTARPGQTKDQTKLIAQGIEKGIAEYKKREKAKARERDKARKKALEQATDSGSVRQEAESESRPTLGSAKLAWTLLAVSWVLFTVAFFTL